jgi:hypothetical protein
MVIRLSTFYFFCILILFSKRKTTKHFDNNLSFNSNTDSIVSDSKAIIDSILKNEHNYKYYQISTNVEFESKEESHSIKGNLRIVSDSVIWISLSAVGIELFRGVFTKDSIKYLNRIEKTFYANIYKAFNNKFNTFINFKILQSLFLNRLFLFDNKHNNYRKLVFTKTADNLYLFENFRLKNVDSVNNSKFYFCFLINKLFKIQQYYATDNGNNRKIEIGYSDFEKVNNYFIAKFISITLKNNFDNYKISFEYKKINNEKISKVLFSVPNGYSKLN